MDPGDENNGGEAALGGAVAREPAGEALGATGEAMGTTVGDAFFLRAFLASGREAGREREPDKG